MTKAELLTDLESKPDILHIIDSNPPLVTSRGNVNQYTIPTLLRVAGNVVKISQQPIIVVDEGQSGEVAYYNGGKNFTEPKRAPHFTTQQYKDGIEGEFAGWKVLDLTVKIDGDTDIVSVKGSDGNNYVTKSIAVWLEGGNPQFKMVE